MSEADQLIHKVLTRTATSKDLLQYLQHFRNWLLPKGNYLGSDDENIDDPLERQFLDNSFQDEDDNQNPFPDHLVETTFAKQELLNKFMVEMFSQRFGWKEEGKPRAKKGQKKTHVKPQLINLLDEFMKW